MLAALKQNLMMWIPSCHRLFGGRAHFSSSLPLLLLVKKLFRCNPSLYPGYTGEVGFTPQRTFQGTVESAIHGMLVASLLPQQLYKRLPSVDSLRAEVRVRLDGIPSVYEALHDLGMFALVISHLFFAGRRHSSDIAEIFHLIERLKELHVEVKRVISSPHLSTTIMYNVS